jgi:hypothetical protein
LAAPPGGEVIGGGQQVGVGALLAHARGAARLAGVARGK